MTRCAKLQKQAERCYTAAMRTKGLMRKIWFNHFHALNLKIARMSVKELSEEIGD